MHRMQLAENLWMRAVFSYEKCNSNVQTINYTCVFNSFVNYLNAVVFHFFITYIMHTVHQMVAIQ